MSEAPAAKPISAPPTPPGKPRQAPGRAQLINASAVALAACAMWYFGVRPMELKLVSKTNELRSTSAELAAFEGSVATESPLDDAITEMNTRARTLNDWTSRSSNQAHLYDSFHAVAQRCKVRIERVEPSSSSKPTTTKDPLAPESFGYAIEVTGTYQAVAKFMDACEQDLGVTKIASFHMSPTPNNPPNSTDPLLTAIIDTSHLKFHIADAVDAKTGSGS